MLYSEIKGIQLALARVKNNAAEHITSTVTNGLANHYFTSNKFTITPEARQGNEARPDYVIERIHNNNLVIHIAIEIKSHSGDSFQKAAEQLQSAITETMVEGDNETYCIYAIIVKGTRIAFFVYYSYASELDEQGINNYKGFIPINFEIPRSALNELNDNSNNPFTDTDYNNYLNNFPLNVPRDAISLTQLNVQSDSYFRFPYI